METKLNSHWAGAFLPAAVASFLTLFACQSDARAALILVDLTSGSGSTGTINGAIFEFDNSRQAAGTGNLDAFVRVQANGAESGYNTSARPVQFDEKTDLPSTHDLLAGDIPLVQRAGAWYFEFLLDINESTGGDAELLSLDQVKIYKSATNFSDGNNPANPDDLGTLVYNMDAGDVGNVVLLDASLSSGSGQADMTLLVPLSAFGAITPGTYVYLYSEFGGRGGGYDTSATFEEWAVLTGVPNVFVPEPHTVALLAMGGLVMAVRSVRRRRRA